MKIAPQCLKNHIADRKAGITTMAASTTKIVLGAWSWGAGAAGGDQVFRNHRLPAIPQMPCRICLEDLKVKGDVSFECGRDNQMFFR